MVTLTQIAFSHADRLERGLLPRRLAIDLEVAAPMGTADSLWRLGLERSNDLREYRLCREDGSLLLLGRVSSIALQVDIFLSEPSEAAAEASGADPVRPRFTLRCSPSKSQWRLLHEQCDACQHTPQKSACATCQHGQRELLRVHHSTLGVGEEVVNCMTVETLPGVDRYFTKLPVWHQERRCSMLDFEGRKAAPSAKNFQLALRCNGADVVVCQHMKLAANSFGLDIRQPMSVVHAFGIALSTICWT